MVLSDSIDIQERHDVGLRVHTHKQDFQGLLQVGYSEWRILAHIFKLSLIEVVLEQGELLGGKGHQLWVLVYLGRNAIQHRDHPIEIFSRNSLVLSGHKWSR